MEGHDGVGACSGFGAICTAPYGASTPPPKRTSFHTSSTPVSCRVRIWEGTREGGTDGETTRPDYPRRRSGSLQRGDPGGPERSRSVDDRWRYNWWDMCECRLRAEQTPPCRGGPVLSRGEPPVPGAPSRRRMVRGIPSGDSLEGPFGCRSPESEVRGCPRLPEGRGLCAGPSRLRLAS